MKSFIASSLVVFLALATLPSRANTPAPGYEQTRDWVVTTITESAGYAADFAAVTYKDVSMDACQLRYTTVTVSSQGYTDTATFAVSLDSVNSVLWGPASDSARSYVLFTTLTPISFSKQTARTRGSQPQSITMSTAVAAIEFGKPGSDAAETASQMRAALLHAASLCKVQVAAK